MTVKDFRKVLDKHNDDDEVMMWDVILECYEPLWEGQLYFEKKNDER